MFRLHAAAYVSDEATFRSDLAGKSWVIRLFNGEGRLCGFSTIVLWHHDLGAGKINVVFAGDTIVDPHYWGRRALLMKWLEVTGALHARHPDTPLYWLLTSMHPRTYRAMPLFYQRFFPNWEVEDAELKLIAHQVARWRFGDRFIASRGIVVGEGPLKTPLAKISPRNMRRVDVRFFVERNPGYAAGDELVCLARLDAANHKPPARRFFLRGAALALGGEHLRLSAAE
jgi:hypothetical protein